MVKEFLLSKKEQIVGRFKKEGNIDKLIQKISQDLENGNSSEANRKYSEIEKIYKILSSIDKKKVFNKCVEIHKRIKNYTKVDTKETETKEEKEIEETIEENTINVPGANKITVGNIEYIKTGIPGFDDLIEKGIPKKSIVLVSGSAGSGKTTFASQVIMSNASQGKKCLYMSFEESEVRLKEHLKQYGWDPNKLEQEGNLLIKRYDPFMISRSIEALLAEARGELIIKIDKTKTLIPEDFKPDLVVVDSLSAIGAAFAEEEAAYRIYIEQLFRSFEKMDITSFLITECEEGSTKLSKTGVEEFLADGVIAFYNMKKGNSRINATEVVKIRGTSHKKKIVPFSFVQGKGMEVYPMQEIFLE